MAADEAGLQVATGQGAVLVKTIQLEGGRRLSAADFQRGHPLQVGTVLGG
ncbi:MAG: hypothetical protein ACLFVT_10210 [Syntrophobacteria bacterium]